MDTLDTWAPKARVHARAYSRKGYSRLDTWTRWTHQSRSI